MKHQQALDKLAARFVIKSIDEDITRLMIKGMSFLKNKSITNLNSYIIPLLLNRWNCVLLANNGLEKNYKETVTVALALLLHKYGLSDTEITEKAIKSIDVLNKNVALSDDFFRKSKDIKSLVSSIPKPLTKKPNRIESITFYRAKDIISIQYKEKYYCAYILQITGVNESPILEFYDIIFDKKPQLKDLKNIKKARGKKLNDGKIYISRHAIYGMKNLPDLANQVHLIGSCIDIKNAPNNSHLETPTGIYTVSNLFSLQKTIHSLFD